MDKITFNKFRRLIYDKAGIQLADGKITLVRARVGKRIRALNLSNEKQYFDYVINDKSNEELIQLLDVISTNVTHFFREKDHFDYLEQAFTSWILDGQRRFRFWSAGCSSGQEPYTLAMVLMNAVQKNGIDPLKMDIKILATDISTKVLEYAVKAEYDESKIEGIPKKLLTNWFDKYKTPNGNIWIAKNSIKKLVCFKRLNLSKPPFPMKGPLDTIFCRNTMIYFDNDVRSKLVGEFRRLVRHDGFLMVGHSESLTGFAYDFTALKPSIYQRQMVSVGRAV